MVALTYGDARVGTAPATKAAAPAARKAWYLRLFHAMIEARMQQARREIRMYTGLMARTGNGNHEAGNTPVGGW